MISATKTILIVEDDLIIQNLVSDVALKNSFKTIVVGSVSKGIQLAISTKPDLVILDLGLPDADGVEFLNNYRLWSNNPVLVLSARDSEIEKVKALDAGADDYITKPFSALELAARLKVLLRRQSISTKNNPLIKFGDVEVDLSSRRVLKGGQDIHLSKIEYQLLSVLIGNSGGVVTHRKLLNEVWGGEHSRDNHYLRIYVGHLRQKLENDPTQPEFLLTDMGVGYRLAI